MISPLPPRRPRVLHIVTQLTLGGAERVALDLTRGLSGEIDFGVFAVHGVGADAIGAAMRRELDAGRIPVFRGTRLPLKRGGLPFAALRLARAARAFLPDVLHLHTEIPEATAAAALVASPALRATAMIRTIHNVHFWSYWPRVGRWCDRRLRHARVVGVSQAALGSFDELRRSSEAGPAKPAPLVIYNGVALPTPTAHPRTHANSPLRLLFAGRFETQKGADLIPEILRLVPLPDGQKAELTLIGAGSHERALRHLADGPPRGWNICVKPPLTGLAGKLQPFDLLLMPSRFEGLPLLAIEAAASGLPIVATSAPGLIEALPVDHPWFARPGDAADFAALLQRVLGQDRALWPVAAERARAHVVARFDTPTMLTRYRELYRQLEN